jgi:hypothetical protein
MRMTAFLVALALLPIPTGATPSDPIARWFNAGRCVAFNGALWTTAHLPPFAKHDPEDLIFDPGSKVPSYVYDPKSHSALYHTSVDTNGHVTLRTSGPPPAGVPRTDLSKLQTTSGIKLGTTAATVVRLLGQPRIISGCGLQHYIYLSSRRGPPTSLEFSIRNGQVIEIFQGFGG